MDCETCKKVKEDLVNLAILVAGINPICMHQWTPRLKASILIAKKAIKDYGTETGLVDFSNVISFPERENRGN